MRTEACAEIRNYFSEYLDAECSPEAQHSVLAHLRDCAPCAQELERERAISDLLRSLPREHVSPKVALRLRVRLSQYLHRNWLVGFRLYLENVLRPMVLPASGGILTTVVFLGLLMTAGIPPVAHTPDVPTRISTPASLEDLNPVNLNMGDEAVVVVTNVDAEGRATSYRIVSGERSPKLIHELDRMIYFSLFQPATMFGTPTNGQVVFLVRRIQVRG